MEDKSIVRVSNVLNLTRQEFSVIEKHILHCVISELKENQGFHLKNIDDFTPIIIKINSSDILKNSKNIDAVKDAIKKITTRSIFFDFSKDGDDYFGSIAPFTYANYIAKKGSKGEIQVDINYKCKKLFLELAQGYTNILLDAVLNLKSEYSIRMYELISMYQKKGVWNVKLDTLRGLIGLERQQYKNYGMFERRILIYSQKELSEHCNLSFTWKIAEKQRKKITALTFYIQSKEQKEKVELNEEIKQTIDFVAKLSPVEIAHTYNLITSKYNLSTKQADYIFSDTKLLNEFIRIDLIIESMIEKGKAPKDRTKYLAKSLGLDKVKF